MTTLARVENVGKNVCHLKGMRPLARVYRPPKGRGQWEAIITLARVYATAKEMRTQARDSISGKGLYHLKRMRQLASVYLQSKRRRYWQGLTQTPMA
jgi:hypothetical protein